MKIEVQYPKQELYAVVTGVDIKSISDSDFSDLYKTVNLYGVTVIKEQYINDEEQIEFSKKFGFRGAYTANLNFHNLRPFFFFCSPKGILIDAQ